MHGTTVVLCESKAEVEGMSHTETGWMVAVQPLVCVSGAQAEAPFSNN